MPLSDWSPVVSQHQLKGFCLILAFDWYVDDVCDPVAILQPKHTVLKQMSSCIVFSSLKALVARRHNAL